MLLDTWEPEVGYTQEAEAVRKSVNSRPVCSTQSSKLASLHNEILFPKGKEISK